MTVSIVLADGHPVVREGLRASLTAESDFKIVAETGDGLETIRLVERLQPDILILARLLPGLNGFDVLPIVRHRSPSTRTIIFSSWDTEDAILQALRNGAHAYVLKGSDLEEIITAVRRVAVGQHFLSPALSERAIDAYWEKAATAPSDPHDQLTPRERQALQLAAEGNSCSEIAARLSISPRTAEMHRAHALRKLGLRTQADLIRYAIRRGMLPPGG